MTLSQTPLSTVLSRLGDSVRETGSGRYMTECPGHPDRTRSLSLTTNRDGAVLLKCFAGCSAVDVVRAMGLELRDLFPVRVHGESPLRAVSVDEPSGLTLAEYAEAKQIPLDVLKGFGLENFQRNGAPCIRIPYPNNAGVRYRLALAGDDRFAWMKGSKPCLYGADRLATMHIDNYVVIVEGESDCHTGWAHDLPVLGVPGAASWQDDWAAAFEGVARIVAILEPDQGGATLRDHLTASPLKDRLHLLQLPGAKDLSDFYLLDPPSFAERWSQALAQARPAAEAIRQHADATGAVLWAACRDLAQAQNILSQFLNDLHHDGLAGEDRLAALLYLSITSRLLDRPVNVAVKGPSSAGKSETVRRVLQFFPASACYALSAMSERALLYGKESLKHRVLMFAEATGATDNDFASYLIRTLLSEGRLRYETVQKDAHGQLTTVLVEREGPTGLLVTTTAITLHAENETRMLSLQVDDSPEQTKAIMRALAQESRDGHAGIDLGRWHALQEWLAVAQHHVTVPFAPVLAEAIPPVATRLRRDFGMLITLIMTHAMLHQASRARDEAGRVVADVDDYRAVRELLVDQFAQQVEATCSEIVRETVDTIRRLTPGSNSCSVTAVARALHLDTSTASRRVKAALEQGLVQNLEAKDGRPYKLVLGNPLPEDRQVLPPVEALDVPTLADPLRAPAHGLPRAMTGDPATPCSIAAVAATSDEPAWVTASDLEPDETESLGGDDEETES